MPEPSHRLPTHALLRTAYNVLAARIFATVIADNDFADLRPAHGNVMEQLDLEDGLRLTDMAARAGITVQSMGELIDDLQLKGYLDRRPDPRDRRVKRIHLTEKGRKNVQVARRATAGVEDHLAALLGQRRHDLLRRAVEDIVAAEADDDDAGGPRGPAAAKPRTASR